MVGFDRIKASRFGNKCVCFTLMCISDKCPSFASVCIWQEDHYPVTRSYSLGIILAVTIGSI